MFFRIAKPGEMKEVFYNSDQITKIEVRYSVPGEDKDNPVSCQLDIESAFNDPTATRWYKVFFGEECINLKANPDDRIRAAVEKICRDALRG